MVILVVPKTLGVVFNPFQFRRTFQWFRNGGMILTQRIRDPSWDGSIQASNVEIATVEPGEFLHFPWQNGKGFSWICPRSRGKKRTMFKCHCRMRACFFSVFLKKELCPLLRFTLIKTGFLWFAGTLLCEGFYLLVSNW